MDSFTRRLDQESFSVFRLAWDRSQIGIVITRGLAPVYANEAFVRLYGFASVEDFLWEGDLARLLPDADLHRLGRFLADGRAAPSFAAETTHFTKSGDPHRVEIVAERIEWHGRPALLAYVHEARSRANAAPQSKSYTSSPMDAVQDWPLSRDEYAFILRESALIDLDAA